MQKFFFSTILIMILLVGFCSPSFAQKTATGKKSNSVKTVTKKSPGKTVKTTKSKAKTSKNKKSSKSDASKNRDLSNPLPGGQPAVNPDMSLIPGQNPEGFPQDPNAPSTRSFFDNSRGPMDVGTADRFKEIEDATKQAGLRKKYRKGSRRVKQRGSDKSGTDYDTQTLDNQDQLEGKDQSGENDQTDGTEQSEEGQEGKPFNPFDMDSVRHHIHQFTAPEKSKKGSAKHHKKEKVKKKVPIKVDPTEIPFTAEWNEKHGRRVLAIIGIMFVILFLAPPVTRRVVRFMTAGRESSEITKRVSTLTLLFSKLITVIVLSLGLFEILEEFSIDVAPMLTGAGIFGVALGFAGQNLLKDYLAGFLLIIEEQMRVGDFVKIAGVSGTVEEISVRKIQLRDFNGNAIYVPNRNVDVVVNMTREYSKYVMNVPVAYKEDYEKVVEILKEVDESIQKDEKFSKIITEPLTIYGLSEFGTNGYMVTIRTTTKPGEQWAAAREYRKRIKERFDALNIEIPVSQMTIHKGTDIKGAEEIIPVDEPGDDSKDD